MTTKKNKYDLKHSQFKYQPDDRICTFYVADKISEIVHMEDGKKAHTKLWEFYEEMLHKMGVEALHHYKNKLT